MGTSASAPSRPGAPAGATPAGRPARAGDGSGRAASRSMPRRAGNAPRRRAVAWRPRVPPGPSPQALGSPRQRAAAARRGAGHEGRAGAGEDAGPAGAEPGRGGAGRAALATRARQPSAVREPAGGGKLLVVDGPGASARPRLRIPANGRSGGRQPHRQRDSEEAAQDHLDCWPHSGPSTPGVKRPHPLVVWAPTRRSVARALRGNQIRSFNGQDKDG